MGNDAEEKQPQRAPSQVAEQMDPVPGSIDSPFYEIHVKGHLNPEWSDWLEGLEVRLMENGEMILCGPIVDQAALLGVLNTLGRLNLALVSVNPVKRKEGEKHERNPSTES